MHETVWIKLIGCVLAVFAAAAGYKISGIPLSTASEEAAAASIIMPIDTQQDFWYGRDTKEVEEILGPPQAVDGSNLIYCRSLPKWDRDQIVIFTVRDGTVHSVDSNLGSTAVAMIARDAEKNGDEAQ